MPKTLSVILFTVYCLLFAVPSAYAIYNPLSVPNNKVGVHILYPEEISAAAELVNNNGGDWGYLTIPIQPTDRDQVKWQQFLDQARDLHLIPIIRITTLPQGGTWATAQDTDLVDFANFLSSLIWPVENRYIVLFNEVNRDSEWGGQVNPAKYAKIVKNARQIFQERHSGFFLLGPALDTALPESKTSISAANFLKAMETEDPAIWSYFDGWASHSYPNPGFSAPPTQVGWQSIVSYKTETSTLKLAPKPIFITETGWDQNAVAPSQLNSYWQQAWNIWTNDPQVAAVTPFVFRGGDQYRSFSLISEAGSLTPSGRALQDLKKVAGNPKLTSASPPPLPVSSSSAYTTPTTNSSYRGSNFFLKLENFFRRLFGLTQKGYLTLGPAALSVEIADSAKLWEKGLSGRDSLAVGQGMLFVFPRVHQPVFWMKEMNFPLDLIWIADRQVIEITPSVPVPTVGDGPTYSPKVPVDMVLEVPAGYAAQSGITVGATLTLEQ